MKDHRIKEFLLDRPVIYNALNVDMIESFSSTLRALDGIQIILLRGAGNNFCSGADLKGDTTRIFEALSNLFKGMKTSSKIVIALIDGYCLAGGFALAAASDLVIAAPGAVFQLPETRRGLLSPYVASVSDGILPKRILKEMALTGESLPASRLYELGFVNQIVPQAKLLDSGYLMAQNILKGGPEAISLTKRMLSQPEISLNEAFEWQYKAFATGEPAEGMEAFKEKRAPKWQIKF